ncbi:MAG: alkaline phosphatase D family protein [Verrucomicrobia bacterium]|nr:alkaline phosphatase D family protein [Verrucomicrobiota bacterium]MDA1048612.1 alkaline phosphatase D family protein [Verrucomicrobiota bacterium]
MRTSSILFFVLSYTLLPLHSLTAKEPIPTPADDPIVGSIEPYLFRQILENENLEDSIANHWRDPALQALVEKHGIQLFGGPMLGDVTSTSAKFWLRTTHPCRITLEITEANSANPSILTFKTKASETNDLTVVLEGKGLKPFTEYVANFSDENGPVGRRENRFRTSPALGQKERFSVAFGGGARYNPPKERIWKTIAGRNPHAFLFLGDNLYQDKPTHRNLQRVYYYRRQMRPEFIELSATTACYAIWDDHDFGANDVSGGIDPFKPAWKLPVWKVFKENWPNPYFGGGEKQPGCWFDFSIGDVDFFMTDGRYYRDFKKGTMLGPVQKQWLKEKLSNSKATFKVIASGTLWTETADKGGKDSWWGVPEEREEIFSLIDEKNIGGVILLSADRHRTDVYKIKRPDGYDLYEFETSKLTNNHTHGTKKEAVFSYNKGNFFGLLDFDLTKKDPEMTFRCITMEDKEVYNLTLRKSQLSHTGIKLENGPKFNFDYRKKGPHGSPNSIEAIVQDSAVVFEVKCGFGIGSGKIKRVNGNWPKKVVVRLHLTGLEGFSVSNGKKILEGFHMSNKSNDARKEELKIRMLDAKGKPVEGKYLLKSLGPNKSERIEGCYEATIPKSLLTEDAKEIQISWVDFYRR